MDNRRWLINRLAWCMSSIVRFSGEIIFLIRRQMKLKRSTKHVMKSRTLPRLL